jgi:hypothetical protein
MHPLTAFGHPLLSLRDILSRERERNAKAKAI